MQIATLLIQNKMKKLFFCMAAAAFVCCQANAETQTIAISSTVTDTVKITQAGDYLLKGDGTVCTVPILTAPNLGNISLTLDGINVQVTGGKDAGISALLIAEGTNATIAFIGMDTLKSSADPGCAIEAKGNIVLNGAKDAKLICRSGGWAAAIGSTPRPKNKVMASGDITINSGIIEAKAGWESAAIGAAVDCKMPNITINGGQIMAKGGEQSAGIGTSYSQWGQSTGEGTITINGGTIVSYAGCSENTWGPSDSYMPIGVSKGDKATVNIVVNGGSVHPVRSDGSAYTAKSIPAKDANGADLVLFTAKLENTTEATAITKGYIGDITLGTDYLINDVYTDAAGYVYFYLPEQAESVEVGLNKDRAITVIDAVQSDNQPRKVLRNGTLYIENNGMLYTATGAAVAR